MHFEEYSRILASDGILAGLRHLSSNYDRENIDAFIEAGLDYPGLVSFCVLLSVDLATSEPSDLSLLALVDSLRRAGLMEEAVMVEHLLHPSGEAIASLVSTILKDASPSRDQRSLAARELFAAAPLSEIDRTQRLVLLRTLHDAVVKKLGFVPDV